MVFGCFFFVVSLMPKVIEGATESVPWAILAMSVGMPLAVCRTRAGMDDPPLPTGSKRPAWNMPCTVSLYPSPSISVHIRPYPSISGWTAGRCSAWRQRGTAPCAGGPGPRALHGTEGTPLRGGRSTNHAFRTPVPPPPDISLPLSSTTMNLYQSSMGTLLWLSPQSSRPPDLTNPPGMVLKGPGCVPSTRSHTLTTQHRASRVSYLLQKHRFENRGNFK